MEKEKKELRRYQNTMVIYGTGVILFGFWNLLKTILSFVFQTEDMREILEEMRKERFIAIFYILFFVIILGVDLLLRLNVGLSARAEGFGQKRKHGYLISAAVLIASSVFSLYMVFTQFTLADSNLLTLLTGAVIELTSMATLIELFVAVLRAKSLEKRLAGWR